MLSCVDGFLSIDIAKLVQTIETYKRIREISNGRPILECVRTTFFTINARLEYYFFSNM